MMHAALIGWAERIVAFVKEQVQAQDARLAPLEAEAAKEPVPSPAQRASAPGGTPGSAGQKPRKCAQPFCMCTVCLQRRTSHVLGCCRITAAGHAGRCLPQ